MNEQQSKVSTIPAGENFAHVLGEYILSQNKGAAKGLTQYKILLPTRRACRNLQEAFLEINKGKPILLPQIMPLGDVEEQDLSLLMFGSRHEFLEIPQAISPMRRKILLTTLIQKIPDFTLNIEHALKLSDAIAALLDQIIIEELDFKNLENLVPADFSIHWQVTLDFLKIISEQWPNILAEQNMVDPAKRRNMLMDNLTQFWLETLPTTPIIAAGSTGSVPATRRLMKAIATLPHGEIILPGLDLNMDNDSWKKLDTSHPQSGLKNLINFIGIERDKINNLTNNYSDRHILASEMMRPAETAEQWKKFSKNAEIEKMLHGLEYYSCKNPGQEAKLIALIIREAIEKKKRNIALITPDRNIASRVISICRRWNIELDDSGGTKLSRTNKGEFILLVLKYLCEDHNPVSLLALLKHPLCRLGHDIKTYKTILNKFELSILRSKVPLNSISMIKKFAEKEVNSQALTNFIAQLENIFQTHQLRNTQTISQIIYNHITILQKLARTNDTEGDAVLWSGNDGEKAAELFIELQEHTHLIKESTPIEYQDLLMHLMDQSNVRHGNNTLSSIHILGQLEGRIISADLIIMAGLNEETWPPSSKHDPWMSRPMKKQFGLPDAEKFIGLAAHDFVQGFCAKNVIITRSEQYDGSPTVPARWLARLDTVLQTANLSLKDLSKNPYLKWTEELDASQNFIPCEQPAPKPPIIARPSSMSVTRIEKWLQDPYSIYAYYILGLRQLEPLKIKHDAALQGSILHKILDNFVRDYPITLPENAQQILESYTQDALQEFGINEREMPFWLLRFRNIVQWFLQHEVEWRKHAKFLSSEARGKVNFKFNGNLFELHCIADRIDKVTAGYALIDYKSAGNFSAHKLKKGLLPQLPLEALILEKNGFEKNKNSSDSMPVQRLSYWIMKGAQTAGEVIEINGDLSDTLKIVEEGLQNLVCAFNDPDIPYYAVPDINNAPRYNDYEHLSRLKEWTVLDKTTDEVA